MSDKPISSQDKELARRRLHIIMQVQVGTMTATQAADTLKISRKTYYEWENRALTSMLEAVTNRPPGRPKKQVDEEKEDLQAQVENLQEELSMTQTMMELREKLTSVGLRPMPLNTSITEARKKKNRKKKKRK